jgi:hypothetical protein
MGANVFYTIFRQMSFEVEKARTETGYHPPSKKEIVQQTTACSFIYLLLAFLTTF